MSSANELIDEIEASLSRLQFTGYAGSTADQISLLEWLLSEAQREVGAVLVDIKRARVLGDLPLSTAAPVAHHGSGDRQASLRVKRPRKSRAADHFPAGVK